MASSLSLNRTRKVPAEDTAAFGAIAERFRRGGALERAVSLCREGLQKFPDHVSARVTLGWSLLDLGKYDEARLELEQVLRRAPDNLAAIRGLAELHDRFEHTLNLPMDGPGQWPPPPEATAHIADEPAAIAAESDPADVEFAPAELGIPIWSPTAPAAMVEAVLDEDVEPEPEIVVHVAHAPVAPPAAAVPAPVPPPVAAVSAPAPPMTATASPAAAVGAGMSSMREIEMSPASEWAGISAAPAAESATIEIEPAAVAAAFAGTDAVADDDAEIAALIAEAESLESAADLIRPQATGAITDVDDVALDESGFEFNDPALELSVAADASDDVDLPLVLDAVGSELADTAETAEAGEIIVQAGAVEVADRSAELSLAEPQAEFVAEAAAAVEPGVVAPEAVTEETIELAPSVDEEGPSFELTAFTPPEVGETDDDAVGVDAVAAAIDESIAPVLPFHVPPVHPALPRLERLLAQVQTRRSQLMAQSVA
jgi:hypothetical protein